MKNLYRVYRNLHAGCYSLTYKGIVVAHTQRVVMGTAMLYVNENGRQRVLDTGHKNIHAGLCADEVTLHDALTKLRPAVLHFAATDPTFLQSFNIRNGAPFFSTPIGEYVTDACMASVIYNPRKEGVWVYRKTRQKVNTDRAYFADMGWTQDQHPIVYIA